MDFTVPESTNRIRSEVRELLESDLLQSELRSIADREDGLDGDARESYRLMGERRLLAADWPPEYGGQGLGFTESAAVVEEMARKGIPLSLYFITVQIVGRLLLSRGTAEQRERLLPAIARGELFACILFTEPGVGSDLAAVTTRAVRDGDGWTLSGHKRFNLKTSYADVALCVARTEQNTNRYEGLTLFLVPLDHPGVRVRPLRSLADEHFHDVLLTGVRVGPEAVVGAPNAAWSLISAMFAGERSGFDYYARGLGWIERAAEILRSGPADDHARVGLARHWARLDAGRLLALRVLQRLHEGEPDTTEASLAKWYCSQTAQSTAWWAAETLAGAGDDPLLAPASREAAGMTISGGASEVLLETIVAARLLDSSPGETPGRAAPVPLEPPSP
ncbi:acyl-CoA dehydrogenase family protein [Streptomyces sp. NPDC001985]|uniref:acyl-CoA dehydrogenase family protein n=1 Tax=Streptomyces sp. NPDC001985 TaxID=3154406 RepID=UPI00331E0C74